MKPSVSQPNTAVREDHCSWLHRHGARELTVRREVRQVPSRSLGLDRQRHQHLAGGLVKLGRTVLVVHWVRELELQLVQPGLGQLEPRRADVELQPGGLKGGRGVLSRTAYTAVTETLDQSGRSTSAVHCSETAEQHRETGHARPKKVCTPHSPTAAAVARSQR